MKQWFVITHYKNNFDLMETFVNFYRRYWGIKKFYFLITVTNQSILAPLQRIKKINSQSDVSIEYTLLHTNNIITRNEWGKIKAQYFKQLNDIIPRHYSRMLNIDNDEFYFVKNVSALKKTNKLHFHFVEFIPHEKFSWNQDLYWSLQGWFYRVIFFRQTTDTNLRMHMTSQELECFKRDICSINGSSKPNQIAHQWCKLVKFNRKEIMSPWAHLDNGKICNIIKEPDSLNDIITQLQNSYFCYHMGVIDRDYFIHKKTRWINPQTNQVMMQVGDIRNDGINDYFNSYYRMTTAYMFKDNFLKKFWDSD